MRNPNMAALFLLSCSVTATVHAEEHRHHKAHEHGAGHLNVALDQNTLMIELSLPAMDVIGFEHPVNSKEERGEVDRATALLQDGLQLFAPTPAAECELVQADVASALLQSDRDTHEHEAEHDEKHAEDEHAHADFDVSYRFNCQLPAQLNALTLSLFEHFPATRRLTAQAITPAGQAGAELTPDKRTLNLK